MLKEGRSAVRSSLQREARTRDLFGPAGANTPHVTAADLCDDQNLNIVERREDLQHVLPLLFINLCDPTELVVPACSFQELSRVVHDSCLTQLVC